MEGGVGFGGAFRADCSFLCFDRNAAPLAKLVFSSIGQLNGNILWNALTDQAKAGEQR